MSIKIDKASLFFIYLLLSHLVHFCHSVHQAMYYWTFKVKWKQHDTPDQDDQDLYALVTQTPVLLPRTSTRQQLVKQGKFGETYHPEDGRELKDKLVKILTNYSNYLEELQGVELELQEQHHFERYAEELYAHYEKLYTQRLRYSQKQKKLA